MTQMTPEELLKLINPENKKKSDKKDDGAKSSKKKPSKGGK